MRSNYNTQIAFYQLLFNYETRGALAHTSMHTETRLQTETPPVASGTKRWHTLSHWLWADKRQHTMVMVNTDAKILMSHVLSKLNTKGA